MLIQPMTSAQKDDTASAAGSRIQASVIPALLINPPTV